MTIPIKPGLKWSNGAPIDANDVVFWFDLLKAAVKESPANWGQFTPGLMPDNVTSITTSASTTSSCTWTRPYNPGFFLNNNLEDTNNVYPLPEHGVEHRRDRRSAPRLARSPRTPRRSTTT